MKKIFLMAGVTAFSVTLFSFSNSNTPSTKKAGSPYCVEISWNKNKWKETINATSDAEARVFAKRKYANCTIVSTAKGSCN